MHKAILEECIHNNEASYLDLVIASFYDPEYGARFMALAFLSSVYRNGHLYVELQDELAPSVSILWPSAPSSIEAVIRQGLLELYEECVVKDGTRIYLQKAYFDEKEIICSIEKLQNVPMDRAHIAKIELLLLQAHADKQITHDQMQALLAILSFSLGVIAGGPGTGKTHTAGVFLRAYFQSTTHELRSKIAIAITGPTGKAAHHLKASIERACGGEYEKIEPHITTATLHALLRILPLSVRSKNLSFLPYDVILVDEASMIDASLMRQLLARIKPGTRLIFLGDDNQLPPVEPGAVFSELIHSKKVPIGYLKECLRCELASIVQLAEHVRSGNIEMFFEALHAPSEAVVFHDIEACNLTVLKQYRASFQELSSGDVDDIKRFRILTPLKDGPYSVEHINDFFHQEARYARSLFLPTIITKNDYELQLMNGEVGIWKVDEKMAYYRVDGVMRHIPTSLLPQHELAFCLSVHKSQGSEFDHVVLILPQGSERFSKNMLYTAITRAKKKIEIYASRDVLKQIIENDGKRLCSLSTS